MKRLMQIAALLTSIALFAAVTILVINSILAHQENAALIAQNRALIAEGKVKDASAAKTRAALLDEVHILLARVDKRGRQIIVVSDKLASVLSYLHHVGVNVPTRFVPALVTTSSVIVVPQATTSRHGKHHGKK